MGRGAPQGRGGVKGPPLPVCQPAPSLWTMEAHGIGKLLPKFPEDGDQEFAGCLDLSAPGGKSRGVTAGMAAEPILGSGGRRVQEPWPEAEMEVWGLVWTQRQTQLPRCPGVPSAGSCPGVLWGGGC